MSERKTRTDFLEAARDELWMLRAEIEEIRIQLERMERRINEALYQLRRWRDQYAD